MDEKFSNGAKSAGVIGSHIVESVRAARGPAHLASKVHPFLGMAVLAAAGVHGVVKGLDEAKG